MTVIKADWTKEYQMITNRWLFAEVEQLRKEVNHLKNWEKKVRKEGIKGYYEK